MDEEIVKFNLRLPKNLYESIARNASLNRRSINNEMIVIFEQYFATIETMVLHFSSTPEKYGQLMEIAQNLGIKVMPGKNPSTELDSPEAEAPAKKGKQ